MEAVTTEALLSPVAMDPTSRRPAREAGLDLGSLFEANATSLYRTVLAYTGGRADIAEEGVSEAFARAAAHQGRLRDPVAWLYRVSFNAANDELRRERRDRHPAAREAVQSPPGFEGLFDALRRLPPRERAVMALFYVIDLPVAEVAQRLGMAAPTVRVHLTRGRRRLASMLGDDEVDD